MKIGLGGPVWKLGLRLVWNLGLGTSVGIGLRGQWKLGLGYIGHSYKWKGPKFEKHHKNPIVYFFNFLPSKTQGFNNHSYEWRGFWLERCKLFYSKRWMTHVCMVWYDVWIFFCISFKNIWIVPHFIVIFNSWNYSTLIFFYCFLNNFFGLINLLTNIFLIISFETLFEWHAWNCQGLGNAWMRWWRLTRKLPQFELVSGDKICLGFP